MRSRKLYFFNDRGQRLAAVMDLPVDRKPRACALFAHCFTCGKNLKAVSHINRALTRQGIAVLRFDFTGLGQSEGDFADTNFSSNVDDLVSAAQFMEREYDAPRILIGHSLGGAAVLVAAQHIPSAVAVATIAAPSDPGHVAHLFAEQRETLEAEGEVELQLAGRPFRIRKQFLEDIAEAPLHRAIVGLDRALLVFHSPVDETVEVEHARRIYEVAHHPKSFISLDRADHLLGREEDARYVGNMIAVWAEKYLPPTDAGDMGDSEHQILTRTGAEGFYTEIKAGASRFAADEPAAAGGTGLGPSPYGLLAAALGACTGMTLRMYADHKGWPLGEVKVHLSHAKAYADDCSGCADEQRKIDHITREIELSGELDATQRTRLQKIADRCPVHRTLNEEVRISTRLKS